ncbi:hypothetical protein OUZ56_025407 [Daphnia magna]|uniref:Uncharacterized protein n=1 Tax=Daphnia magna TaxID=35525 RepID=A0ABQ9ZJS0_9CRUS|nr:hypothetical protein OUZ56_025407 [Daphnia magna]
MASSHQTTERRRSNSHAMPSTSSTSFCQRRTVFRPRLQSLLPLCYLVAAVSCWTLVHAGWQDDILPRRSITLVEAPPGRWLSMVFGLYTQEYTHVFRTE